MDPYFQERLNTINDAVSWGDILSSTRERGTTDCIFCGKKGKAYLYPNFFKCFSSHCGVKGGKISIYQQLNGLSFMEAVVKLEDTHHLDPKKQVEEVKERSKLLNECLDAYHNELIDNKDNKDVLQYLYSRGFDEHTIRLWRIGYASSNSILSVYGIPYNTLFRNRLANKRAEFFEKRIIFPIYNRLGSLVHLTGRRFPSVLNDDYKYLDSPALPVIGASKDYLLFENEIPSYLARGDKTIYLTEGVPDTFLMKQLGYPVVGLMGLNKLLHQGLKKFDEFKHVIALFDNDRFESDHLNYPNEKKSWRVVMDQLIDLQLYLGMDTKISCCEIPEHLPLKDGYVKDINDLYLYFDRDSHNLKNKLENTSLDLIEYIVNDYGGDLSKHEIILKLISATNRGKELIEPYIPQDYSKLDYAIKVLRS